MGREIRRVPLDFDFPIGASFADADYDKHRATCDKDDHDDCEWPYWADSVPTGVGWQLWQTVSDGPISPVFATDDELIDWMCQPCTTTKHYLWDGEDPRYPFNPWSQGWRREVAEPFVKRCGWAPSMVVQNGRVMSGPEAMVADLDGPDKRTVVE
jgi:hypothetical protein